MRQNRVRVAFDRKRGVMIALGRRFWRDGGWPLRPELARTRRVKWRPLNPVAREIRLVSDERRLA